MRCLVISNTSVTFQASRKSVIRMAIENYLEIDLVYEWSMTMRTTFLTNGNQDYILPANKMWGYSHW